MLLCITGQQESSRILEPSNGTIISAEVGSINVTTIRCELFGTNSPSGPPVQKITLWNIENGPDLFPINSQSYNTSILLHGNEVSDSIVFSTAQNLLTILRFEASFNNVALRCGLSTITNIGRFPLIAYSKQALFMCHIMPCVVNSKLLVSLNSVLSDQSAL